MTPLYKPYMPSELPELINILRSGELAYGKWGKKFEEKLSDYIGNSKLLTTNSYNSAMLVAIAVLGLKQGDEIIASPMSCLASNQPFATQSIKINWADIDPKTGTLDPEDVKNKITKNTKAIFHNHHCGYVGYVNEINRIAKEKGLFIVDDAIEAFGSEYFGKKMGNLGADITVFSFQTVRLPNTIDGGALSFNANELYEKAIMVRDYGIDRKKFRDQFGEISKECDISLGGFGATLSDVNGYIGFIQLEKIENLLVLQRKNALKNQKIIKQIKDITPLKIVDGSNPNYWVYGIKAENKLETIKMFRNKDIYASGVHLNNNLYSVFNNMTELKGVDDFYSKFVAVPSGWWIQDYGDIDAKD